MVHLQGVTFQVGSESESNSCTRIGRDEEQDVTLIRPFSERGKCGILAQRDPFYPSKAWLMERPLGLQSAEDENPRLLPGVRRIPERPDPYAPFQRGSEAQGQSRRDGPIEVLEAGPTGQDP